MLVALALTGMGGDRPMSDELADRPVARRWERARARRRRRHLGRLEGAPRRRADSSSPSRSPGTTPTRLAQSRARRRCSRGSPADGVRRCVDAGPGFLATEWVAGSPLDPKARTRQDEPRAARGRRRARASVAALEELHQAGVRHGDVKPQNVLRGTRHPVARRGRRSRRDAHRSRARRRHRGASRAGARRATRRPSCASAARPVPRRTCGPWGSCSRRSSTYASPRRPTRSPRSSRGRPEAGEPARWVGRSSPALREDARARSGWPRAPPAGWASRRRGRGREPTGRSGAQDLPRRARPRRAAGSASRARPSASRREAGFEEAMRLGAQAVPGAGGRRVTSIEPMGAVRRARWLVSLVGPSAAAWPSGGDDRSEGELVERAVALARDARSRGLDARRPDGRGRRGARGAGARETTSSASSASSASSPARRRDPAAIATGRGRARARHGRRQRSPCRSRRLSPAPARRGAPGPRSPPPARPRRTRCARSCATQARAAEEAEAAARRALAASDCPTRWAGAGDARAPGLGSRRSRRGRAAPRGRARPGRGRGAGARRVAARHLRARAARARCGAVRAARGRRPRAPRGVRGAARALAGRVGRRRCASFGRAVELAARAGAVVEEATYLTSEAAAATDAGDMARALASATRAALLWERLGRPDRAARAWLARAGSLATHRRRARRRRGGGGGAHAGARVARRAGRGLRALGPGRGAAAGRRAGARLGHRGRRAAARGKPRGPRAVRGAPARLGARTPSTTHASPRSTPGATTLPAPARWEWWGARAPAILAGRRTDGDAAVLGQLVALARRAGAAGLARARARRRRCASRPSAATATRRAGSSTRGSSPRAALREGTPPEHAAVARVGRVGARRRRSSRPTSTFAPAQVAQLEAIVRALSGRDRLRPLLEQVLDTMVLWTGVERGLLLLRAPGRPPRPARRAQPGAPRPRRRPARALADDRPPRHRRGRRGRRDRRVLDARRRARQRPRAPAAQRPRRAARRARRDARRRLPRRPRAQGRLRSARARVGARRRVAGGDGHRRRARRRPPASRGAPRRARARPPRGRSCASATPSSTSRARSSSSPATAARRASAYDEIAGRSEPMRELLRLVDRVTGERRPGARRRRERDRQGAHRARDARQRAARARRAFVSENCASVPETLLESTLFGHVRGRLHRAPRRRAPASSTSPTAGRSSSTRSARCRSRCRPSCCACCRTARCARSAASARARSTCASSAPRTATSRRWSRRARSARTCFYRLNVITLRVPPLRERPEDIPLLVDHFVEKHAGRAHGEGHARGDGEADERSPGPATCGSSRTRCAARSCSATGAIDVAELSADVVRGGPSAARGAGLDLRTRVDALETELVDRGAARRRAATRRGRRSCSGSRASGCRR